MKIIKLFRNISFKKIIIYSILTIIIFLWLQKMNIETNIFSDKVYAAGEKAWGGLFAGWWYKNSAEFANNVVKILSWAWIVPAMVAWKLMNNEFVYWKIFNLDTYLWKMWNMMRSFANYTLAFLLLVSILKTLFKWEPMSVVKDLMPKILFSAVLIQASWFILGAMIDMSTVLTAAVAAIPAKMVKEWDYKTVLSAMIKKIPKECSFNDWANSDKVNFSTCSPEKIDPTKEVEETIAPNYKTLNWPLIFLGYAIMKFHDYNFINSNQDSSKSISITLFLEFIIIIMFVLPIIILAIVNVMRVFYIRLWAVFSPFVVVFNVFGGDKNWGKMMSEIKQKHSKIFDIKNVIWLIFQPVAVVWTLSVAFILILWLSNIFYQLWAKGSWKDDVNKFIEIDGSNNKWTIKIDWEDRVTLKWSIVKDSSEILWWGLGYLILALFTIILLWWVLRIGFHTTEITAKFSDGVFNFAKGMMMAVPILPWGVSLSSAKKAASGLESYTAGEMQNSQAGRIQQMIESKLPSGMQDLNVADMQKLKQELRSESNDRKYTEKLFNWLNSQLSSSGKNLTLESSSALSSNVFDWAKSQQWLSYIQNVLWINDSKTIEEIKKATKLEDILQADQKLRGFIHEALSWKIKNYNDAYLQSKPFDTAPDANAMMKTIRYPRGS